MVFHWCLRDSKSSQVSRTLLSILAVPYNAVILMVFTRPPTSKSSSSFNKPLVTVPKARITIGVIVTFMFNVQQFFPFPSQVEVIILLFTFFQFYSVLCWDRKVHNSASSVFFVVIIIRSGCLAEIT